MEKFIKWKDPGTGGALLLCGIFLPLPQTNTCIRRRKNRIKPSHKDIIITSCCSPLDILYLTFSYNPIFTISFPNTSLVQHVSGIKALFYMFSAPKKPSYKDCMTLNDLSKLYPNRIISVFPEGTTSNGRGLLLFTQSLQSSAPQTRIFPLSIKYDLYLTTPHPNCLFTFLFRLTFKLTHKFYTKLCQTPINFENDEEKIDEIASISLSELSKIPRLNLGVDEKVEFLKAWKTLRKV
ncbi:hypothetical protein PCANB_001061 [Pneumocystis canis]|nr:hypothetical protein PCANB_001061 [Pneumocystis canis]